MRDHNYIENSTSDFVLPYVGGFIARRGEKFAKHRIDGSGKKVACENCIDSLNLGTNENVPDCYKLIEMRTKGFLKKPPPNLLNLLRKLEDATLSVVNTTQLNVETIQQITTALDNFLPLPLVGCQDHQMSLTTNIVTYYLTTRMFFITNQENKNDNIESEKAKKTK